MVSTLCILFVFALSLFGGVGAAAPAKKPVKVTRSNKIIDFVHKKYDLFCCGSKDLWFCDRLMCSGTKVANGTEVLIKAKLYLSFYEPRGPFQNAFLPTMDFCCKCTTLATSLCPICRYDSSMYCNEGYLSNMYPMTVWFNDEFSPLYRSLFYIEESVEMTPSSPFYRTIDQSPYVNLVTGLTKCTPKLSTSKYSYVETSCFSVIDPKLECERGNFEIIDQCSLSNVRSEELPNALACLSPFRRNRSLKLMDSETGFCDYNSRPFYVPSLRYYFLGGFESTEKLLPVYKGYYGAFYYFEQENFEGVEDYLARYSSAAVFGQRIFNYVQKFSWNQQLNPAYMKDTSFVGDIMLRYDSPCSGYVAYNLSHSICIDAYSDIKTYRPSALFRRKSEQITYKFEKPSLNLFGNYTCKSGGDFVYCLWSPTLNIFQKNLTEGVNSTMHSSVRYLIDLMGKNDSSVYFYHDSGDGLGRRLVGNWISGIFGALIQPFFDIFFVMVKLVVSELVEFVIIVLNKVVELFVALLDPLVEFVATVFKLIVSVIAKLESKFLLLEYALLFVFLVYNFRFTTTVALIFVIMAMIIFGITRKSPSLILYFVNEEYVYFNISAYYLKQWDYNYRVSYIQGSVRYTYSFKDSSITNKPN